MKRTYLLLGLSIFIGVTLSNIVKAVCPVCVVAIGTCVGLSRWFGVDDVISGLWIGGLIISMIIWFLDWLNKKNIYFKFRNQIVFLSFYLFTIWPLYLADIMGHPLNKIWGIDKILFGIIIGSLLLTSAVFTNGILKKKNNGKVYFPYQKVVIPLLFLLIISVIFHFIIGCQIKIPFKI